MMKVLTRISTLEAGKVRRNYAVMKCFFCCFFFFSVFNKKSILFSCNSKQSCGRVPISDQTVLETLCSGSSGDIRSAINSLQFFSLPGQEWIAPSHHPPHMHAMKFTLYFLWFLMTLWPARHVIRKGAMEDEKGQTCFKNKSDEEVQTDKTAGRRTCFWRERCFSVPFQSSGKNPALQTWVTSSSLYTTLSTLVFPAAFIFKDTLKNCVHVWSVYVCLVLYCNFNNK